MQSQFENIKYLRHFEMLQKKGISYIPSQKIIHKSGALTTSANTAIQTANNSPRIQKDKPDPHKFTSQNTSAHAGLSNSIKSSKSKKATGHKSSSGQNNYPS